MATIYDVAKECGVSSATVSNVVNNGPKPVRPETRKKILEAIERLNYHPNAFAQGLAKQKTHTIGILFGVVDSAEIVINAYSAAILQAVLSVAGCQGYNVTHITAPWKGAKESLSAFRNGRCDGYLVVAPPTDSDMIPALRTLEIPLVTVSWLPDQRDAVGVDIDDSHGTELLIDHLLSLGHRRIAHITGHPNLGSAQVRERVFRTQMLLAGVPVPNELVLPAHYSQHDGYIAAKQLLQLPEPPTAIFAANDEIAAGVYEAARELKVNIPTDLSVVAVDDRPLSQYLSPKLTTLHQPFDQVGQYAAQLLLQQIEGIEVENKTHYFKPEVVLRESTATPNPILRPTSDSNGGNQNAIKHGSPTQ